MYIYIYIYIYIKQKTKKSIVYGHGRGSSNHWAALRLVIQYEVFFYLCLYDTCLSKIKQDW